MYQGKIEFESDSKDECLKYTDSKKKTKKRRAHVPAKKTAADVEDADAILKKSKKEKNEKKKKIEAAQKHTAITTAEELFKCSFLTASHATNDVSLNNIEVPLTSSPAPSCTPDYEPISPVTSSSPVMSSSPVKSSSPQSRSSQACSVDSLPHFNRGYGFPSPFHPLPPFYYPMYQQNQNHYPSVFPNNVMNVPSPPKLNLSTATECPPSHSDSSTHLLNMTSDIPCTVDNDLNVDCDSRANINTDAGANVSSCPATSSQSGSFLSALSDNGCGECILKDTELNSSREFQNQQERDIAYWKSEALKLRVELEALKKNSSESAKETSDGQSNHYLPKRGICVDKCCYVVAENPENFTIPRGYVKFVDGHDIYIEAKWLSNIKSLFRGKTKPHCLKLIMNGFYEPHEIQKKTAMILLQTPLGQALKAFAVTTLGMDSTDIVKAINTKIGTMCRSIKENRQSK